MKPSNLQRLILFLLSIFFPGSSYLWLKNKKLALYVPLTLFFYAMGVCWSGLLFANYGSLIFIGGLFSFYIFTFVSTSISLNKQSISTLSIRVITVYFVCYLLAILLFYSFSSIIFGFKVFQIYSASMQPKLMIGDVVLADTRWFAKTDIFENDIILFKKKSGNPITYIKRVIAKEGSYIQINNGDVIVNKRLVTHVYNPLYMAKIFIPKDEYFVLGDNYSDSHDSRFWGNVERKNIVALYRRTIYTVN